MRGEAARRWFVVRTQPRKERLALEHLARQGYETFCPMWRGVIPRNARKQPLLAPLFPSYVFAALDLQRDRWRSINGTIGCIGLVSFGQTPAALPAGFIDTLRAASGAAGEAGFAEDIALGSHVRIVGGAFDNMCGTLLEKNGVERVTILLDVLSRATRVEIASARLIAA